MDLLKALGGMNAVNSAESKPQAAADKKAQDKKTPAQSPASTATPEPQFNPMADIIERHENAINRLRRGK